MQAERLQITLACARALKQLINQAVSGKNSSERGLCKRLNASAPREGVYVSEGESPSGLVAKPPGFRKKELNGKV
jgi:hypothetical protein